MLGWIVELVKLTVFVFAALLLSLRWTSAVLHVSGSRAQIRIGALILAVVVSFLCDVIICAALGESSALNSGSPFVLTVAAGTLLPFAAFRVFAVCRPSQY